MIDPGDRRWSPGRVPDRVRIAVDDGLDTDADGRADTLVTGDGVDLVVATDLDADGFADQVLRIGPDGVVREVAPPADDGAAVLGGLLGGAGAGCVPG